MMLLFPTLYHVMGSGATHLIRTDLNAFFFCTISNHWCPYGKRKLDTQKHKRRQLSESMGKASEETTGTLILGWPQLSENTFLFVIQSVIFCYGSLSRLIQVRLLNSTLITYR